MMGLNVANVVGVPAVTWLGQQFGWRWMFAAVALTGVLTWVGIKVFVPFSPAHAEASIRRELSALRRGQVWLAMATGIVGFGGFFAVYAFISPILTDVTGAADHRRAPGAGRVRPGHGDRRHVRRAAR